MRFVAYVMLLFCVSLMLYFMGYRPIIDLFNAKGSGILAISCPVDPSNPTAIPICTNQDYVMGAVFLFILGATGLVALMSGFAALYVIPMLLLMAVLNFFIFPLNFIFGAPELLRIPVLAFYNIITVLAAMNFIRGGT